MDGSPIMSLFMRNSIGLKVFGAIAVLLLLMATAAAISMWEARAVGDRLDRAVNTYIPTYAALARANVRSLEQALLLRRIIIAHSTGGASAGDVPGSDSVAAKGKAVAEELASARQMLAAEIASFQTFGDVTGLVRLDTRLEAAQAERERLNLEQDTLLKALATNDRGLI